MLYNFDYPATWAGVNKFVSSVLSLFTNTVDTITTQPVLTLWFDVSLLALAFCLFFALSRAARGHR